MQGKVTRTRKLFSSQEPTNTKIFEQNRQKIPRTQKYSAKMRKNIEYVAKIPSKSSKKQNFSCNP
jgi:hypothetical protein